jgi:hypothetical protein
MQGNKLVREISELSSRTAIMLLTAGLPDSASFPPASFPKDTGPLKRAFSTSDLIAMLEAAIERSVQLSADFKAFAGHR